MMPPRVTIAIPTLLGDECLYACLRSLERQTTSDFEVIVVDNGGSGAIRATPPRVRVIVNPGNLGFGAAVNQVIRLTESPFLAVLNDDTVVEPDWLEALLRAADANPDAGLFACRILLAGTGLLDSTGMLIAGDGSSKQRGHGRSSREFEELREALFPSGCAALYRRATLEDVGLFDESFFLFCEDTDLGLRARWAGWNCYYVANAVVHHIYSHSAGEASPLKAYLVERNRIFTAIKTFPLRMLWSVPMFTCLRYVFYAVAIFRREGKGHQFLQGGNSALLLPWLVIKAHLAAFLHLPQLLKCRRQIAAKRRMKSREFAQLLKRHSIGLRQLASL